MAQLDDHLGLVMKKLKDMGVDHNTIVVFTTGHAPRSSPGPTAAKRPSRRVGTERSACRPAALAGQRCLRPDSVQNGIS